MIFWAFGSLRFEDIFPQAGTVAPWIIMFITIAMLLGVTGKSAQLPLFVWLPDAMAGPTPVSALIHAATLGPAGACLGGRSQGRDFEVPAAQRGAVAERGDVLHRDEVDLVQLGVLADRLVGDGQVV